ncbi:delta(24)-sterol C-methyltransferase [Catellatospora sp. TT07R-123]|uniref:methyltransferase domain-containing protein n=1 Tax=Catellatospora sp. TT07R-123 TaxID=2733863 RepID=UPI001B1F9DBD|nr:methyltransferase domain-containing protein [Catellatospora sp. TT07R-123]GHJ47730.1 delta(24)-sterol C-methyltransferase [Catellatospora sp. TT07R-123]
MAEDVNKAVEQYYDSTIDLYEGLWGEHVHHGYWDLGSSPADDGPDRHAASDRTVRELLAFAGIPAGAHLLDAGCGIGGPALHLAREHGCRVEGITLSSQQVVRATERAHAAGLADRVGFRQLDAVRTDYPDATFDAVWALESLEHMPDRTAFLAEALRVLKPGGVLAVSTWCVRDGELDEAADALLAEIYERQAIPSLPPIGAYDRWCREAGFAQVRVADWAPYVAGTWDTDFAGVERLDLHDHSFLRELARRKGVAALRFFYAIPLMKQAYADGVMRYAAVAAVKP